MADPEPSKPSSPDPEAHRRALVGAQARGIAAREFVDILTCPGSGETVRFEVRWERDVTALGRPGTGGRQPSINRSFEIEATRETREWLGEPRDHTHRGSLLHVWEIPDGEDGIIAARLSGQDVKNHETVFGQIHGLLEICKRAKLKPKYLIASMRNSGFRDYETRLDFAFIRDRVHAGDCSWVGYFKVDRIARDLLPAQLFYRFLRDTGTGMYLEELGRQVDWSNESDMLLLNTLGTIGQFEGTRIKKRTHEPLVRRWLNTGRGWPSAKRMGFKRDAGDRLVVDPLQWPHLKFAHMEYAGSGDGGATSIRTLRRVLEERGFKVSRDKLRKVLHDPIYVTGEWSVTYQGQVYPGRTIALDDPVPLEVFQRNQRLLGITQGKQRVNPIGHYLLNRVQLTHAACRHLVDERGRSPILRGSNGTYKHKKCPQPECRGFSVTHEDLDTLVVDALLKLCESPELQAEYEQRADRAITADYDDRGRIATLRGRLRLLEQQEARIRREWLEEGIAAGHLDPAKRAEALSDIEQDMHACRRQLEYAERKRDQIENRTLNPGETGRLLERAREILTRSAPSDPDLAQRRIMFVDRALSEVRIGDGEVTLFGPLIPEGGLLISANPLEHAAEILTDTTGFEACASKPVRLSRVRGDCDAQVAWKSAPLPLAPRRIGRWSSREPRLDWEVCLAALRSIDAASGPGVLARAVIAASYESLGLGVDGRRLVRSIAAHGATLAQAWIAALGDEASLVAGRRWCATESEVRRAVGAAVDGGVRFRWGWCAEWDEFARGAPWVGGCGVLIERVRRLGLDLDEVIARELEARGAPGAVVDSFSRGGGDSPALVLETLRAADARLEAGQRLSAAAVDRVCAAEPWTAHGMAMRAVCRRRRMPWDAAVRAAIGDERAVQLGRVRAANESDWRLILRGALKQGLVANPDWRMQWETIRGRGWWLPLAYTFITGVGGVRSATELVYDEAGAVHQALPPRYSRVPLTTEELFCLLRRLSDSEPPGFIGERELISLLAGRNDVASWHAVRSSLRRGSLTLAQAWRAALGRATALELQRVRAHEPEDLRVVVGAGLDAGARLRPGWTSDWDAVANDAAWIPRYDTMCWLARRSGARLRDIALELSVERDLPIAPMPRPGPMRHHQIGGVCS